VGSTLALAHPLYYDRLVQLASKIKFVHQILVPLPGSRCFVKINFCAYINFTFLLVILIVHLFYLFRAFV
jgi:hypothetical protein